MEALALRDCLSQGENDLPRRFFRAAVKPIGQAWQLAVGGDLNLPEVQGRPPVMTRLLNGYVDRVLGAAEVDAEALLQFVRVAWLVDSPVKLLRPSMIRRLVNTGRRAARSAVVLGEELPDGVGGVQGR